jgi:hypothetical protein
MTLQRRGCIRSQADESLDNLLLVVGGTTEELLPNSIVYQDLLYLVRFAIDLLS